MATNNMDDSKFRKYIFRYLGEKIDYRRAEWRITQEQRAARLNDLKRQADKAKSLIEPVVKVEKKKRRLEGQKKADKKYREQNLEKRRQQLREAQKRYRDKKKEEERKNRAAQRILRFIRDRKKARKNNLFKVFITFTANFYYMTTDSHGRRVRDLKPRRQTDYINISISSPQINLRVVNEHLAIYIDSLIDEYGSKIWKIDLLDFDYTFTQIDFRYNNNDMINQRMRQIGIKNIDGYPEQTWLKNQGTCVFDYLQHRYKDIKGLKTRFSTYENINLMLNGIDPVNPKPDDEDIEIDDFINNGVPTYAICELCKICGLCLYALHDDDKTFHHYKPPNYNSHYRTIMYRLSNEHIYPIEDNNTKKSIIKIYELSTSSEIFHYESKKKIKEIDTIEIKDNVEIIEGVVPIEYLARTIKEKKIPSQISYSNSQLKSFEVDKIQYVFNQDVEYMKKLCKNLKIEYKGQGAVTMINYIIELALGHPMPKSCPNKLVNDTLITAKMGRAHTGLIEQEFIKLLEDPLTKAYDINKCYTYNLYNARDEWQILDFNDTWEDVEEGHFDKNDIPTGLYYVKTFDTLLFKGDNVYSNIILNKAVKEDIKFTVTKQLIPSRKAPKDIFVSIINKIVKATKGITREGKPLYKYLNNMISGLLGKSKVTYSKVNINSNIKEILYSLGGILPDVDETTIDKIAETEYYIYGGHKHVQLAENNIPMYIQVLDASNVQLYDLIKAVGGQLLGRKVDCVAVYKPNKEFDESNISYGKQWGQFQEADNIPIMLSKERHNDNKFVFSTKWKEFSVNDSAEYMKVKDLIDKHNGLMIRGGPGVGKSYVAKKLAELLPRNIRIAPTNKAARNINGKTIHRFLTISDEKKISPVHIKSIKSNYEYVIVDEISMITKELWHRLMLLKTAIPKLIFVLIGDENQLPPVEPDEINTQENYFNHPAVKYLANSKLITLKKVYRYSAELKEHLNDILNDKEFNYKPYLKQGFTDTRYNICFFNKTRKAVNAYWNKKETPKQHIFIPENTEDEYTQDMNIYINLPVIARKTIKKGEVCCNNELFTVTDYDDKDIHLYTIRDDEPHYIQIPTDKFREIFLLNYCCTVHKSQGETLSEKITIYDWNSSKLNYFDKLYIKKIRYTALSRIELKSVGEGFELLADKLYISNVEAPQSKAGTIHSKASENITKKINKYYETDKNKNMDLKNFIDVKYIENLRKQQMDTCAMCHKDMLFENYPARCMNQFSVDRIDSNLGHVKGNVRLTCLSCNVGKKNNY